MCVALDREAAAAFGSPHADQALRGRQLVHRRLHAEVMLLLERLLDPASAARYRDPAWTEESGCHILREPNKGDPVASQVFFVLHRYCFGQFVRAVLDGAAEEPRLRLLDDRSQILELPGTLAGYRRQSPRATIWILRIAGVDDHLDRMDLGAPLSALEDFVYANEFFTWER